jgi:hypothetical protein
MAPERILCEGDTPAGDVYATVATVVELLLGRPLGRTPVLAERHEPFVEAALEDVRPLIEAEQEVVDAVLDAFTRGLATEPGARPTARALSDELEQLARRVRSEALAPFARRVVPRVEEVLGHQREPATGILHERSTSSELTRKRSNPTLAVAGESEGGATRWVEATPAPAPARRKGGGAVLVGAVGLLAAVFGIGALVALGVALWLRTPTDLPAPVDVPVEAAPVQPEPPPVEPAPVEPENDEGPDETEPVDGAAPDDGTPDETTAPIVAPQPAVPDAAPAKPAPAPAKPKPDAPRVSRAQINLKDASSLTITCGDRSASGTASARITEFPAGPCDVRAVFLGQTLSTTTTVDRPRAVTCTVASGALACP